MESLSSIFLLGSNNYSHEMLPRSPLRTPSPPQRKSQRTSSLIAQLSKPNKLHRIEETPGDITCMLKNLKPKYLRHRMSSGSPPMPNRPSSPIPSDAKIRPITDLRDLKRRSLPNFSGLVESGTKTKYEPKFLFPLTNERRFLGEDGISDSFDSSLSPSITSESSAFNEDSFDSGLGHAYDKVDPAIAKLPAKKFSVVSLSKIEEHHSEGPSSEEDENDVEIQNINSHVITELSDNYMHHKLNDTPPSSKEHLFAPDINNNEVFLPSQTKKPLWKENCAKVLDTQPSGNYAFYNALARFAQFTNEKISELGDTILLCSKFGFDPHNKKNSIHQEILQSLSSALKCSNLLTELIDESVLTYLPQTETPKVDEFMETILTSAGIRYSKHTFANLNSHHAKESESVFNWILSYFAAFKKSKLPLVLCQCDTGRTMLVVGAIIPNLASYNANVERQPNAATNSFILALDFDKIHQSTVKIQEFYKIFAPTKDEHDGPSLDMQLRGRELVTQLLGLNLSDLADSEDSLGGFLIYEIEPTFLDPQKQTSNQQAFQTEGNS